MQNRLIVFTPCVPLDPVVSAPKSQVMHSRNLALLVLSALLSALLSGAAAHSNGMDMSMYVYLR